MRKKNVIICYNPRNIRGDTAIPKSIVKEFAYNEENSEFSQGKRHYGIVTIKDLERYTDFFNQYHVPMEIIHRLFSEYGAQIRIRKDFIEAACRGDRWRIWPVDKNQVLLEHNNYKKGLYGGRYFDAGYHVQRKSSFTDVLEYIMKYNYKRKHCPKKVIQKEFKKALTDSLTSQYEAVFESREKVKKKHVVIT